MNDEEFDELSARLRALAASTAEAQAPPRLEAALRAAFRRRRARPWRMLVAAAAVLIAIAGAALVALREPPLEQVRVPMAAPAPPPVQAARAPLAQPKPARRVRRAPAARREVVTEFIPLVNDYRWSAAEPAQMIRVRMPRSALVPLGLPLNEDRALEPVKADVIVGYDGVARAIRFVR